jgi:uncharacterized protein
VTTPAGMDDPFRPPVNDGGTSDAPAHLNPRLAARLARHRAARPSVTCRDVPPGALQRGIEQFNHREYFECHETLEGVWNEEPGPVRTLYKGILQVGVGCYHLLRGNYHGATVKLQSGAVYLEPFAPQCLGVNVAQLIADARRLRAALVTLGPERFIEVDLALLPRITLEGATPD